MTGRIQEDFVRKVLDDVEDYMDNVFVSYPWKEGMYMRLKQTVLDNISQSLATYCVPFSGHNDQLRQLFSNGNVDGFAFGFCSTRLGRLLVQYTDYVEHGKIPSQELFDIMDVRVSEE